MNRRRDSDASLVIGLVLGIVVGVAVVVILSAKPGDGSTFPKLNTSNASRGSIERARTALQEKDEERTEGAAEGAAG